MMRSHHMRKPAAEKSSSAGLPAATLLADVFRTAQEIYKTGLIGLVNSRRRARGLPPVRWPRVGATPSQVRWSHGAVRLFKYDAPAPTDGANAPKVRAPVLLVCSMINRPYILDLLPGRSVVERLLAAGREVWLLDWGNPEQVDDERSLEDWALDIIPRALRQVQASSGVERVHVLGYCMGGTLSLLAMAREALPAASLIALATPVDFSEGGILSMWCRAPGFDPQEIVKVYGHVPPHLLQPAFKMLDPVGMATKLLHLEEKIDDDDFVRFFLAMETWLEDSVNFPGRAFADWVELYRSNTFDLSKVRGPILSIIAKEDYITPPAAALALERKAPNARHERIEWAGGHIGLATSGGAQRKLWPAVTAWLDTLDLQQAHDDLTRLHQKMVQTQKKGVQSPKKETRGKRR
jgi:polyhydroxyalkanoate synthase